MRRQRTGSGINERPSPVLNLLNSRNWWVRLAPIVTTQAQKQADKEKLRFPGLEMTRHTRSNGGEGDLASGKHLCVTAL